LFLTGGIFLAEGAEMLVMGSITSLLHRHWELNPAVRGGMVSIVFIGFSVGNFISGQIGDRFGRRTSILLAYAMIAFFGFATACSQGPGFMIFLRFFVGVGCGIGFPAAYSLMPEVAPSGWRSSLNTLMIGFMPLGELIGALVVLFVDPELDNSARGCSMDLYYPSRALIQPELCAWKTLCEMSAIPAFLFLILASKFLDESPQFLANCGRYEECEEVLQRMAKLNGSQLDVEKLRVAFSVPHAEEGSEPSPTSPSRSYSFRHVVAELCSADFLPVVSFMCLAHIVKDFGVFGLSYMLPQYFVFLKNLTAGVELMVVATLAMPGVVLTYLCSRIPGVSLVYWMSGSAALWASASISLVQLLWCGHADGSAGKFGCARGLHGQVARNVILRLHCFLHDCCISGTHPPNSCWYLHCSRPHRINQRTPRLRVEQGSHRQFRLLCRVPYVADGYCVIAGSTALAKMGPGRSTAID